MATLNEIVRGRKAYWRELKRLDRSLDTAQERLQRRINAVLTRKRNVPTVDDLSAALSDVVQIESALVALANWLGQGYEV